MLRETRTKKERKRSKRGKREVLTFGKKVGGGARKEKLS